MLTGRPLSVSDSKLKNFRLANWILAGTVAVGLVSILFGLLENRRLGLEKRQLQLQLQRVGVDLPCNSPRVGDIVPPIEASTSEGKRISLNYTGTSKYLLFFLSFNCNECVSHLPDWNEIAKRATAKNVSVLGMVTDKQVNTSAPNPNFDILTTHDPALLRAYRIEITPTVMLISEQGRIQWTHTGSLSDASTQELLNILEDKTVEY
jgi:peroxiredoxin